MIEKSLPVKETSKTYDKPEFESKDTLSYDMKWHGKHEVTIDYIKKGKLMDTDLIDYVLTADEYNIAMLEATVPTSYFTLIAADKDGETFNSLIGGGYNPNAPKIITMERSGSYNWEELLPNMYGCPFLTEKELEQSLISGKNYAIEQMEAMREYMTYLYELNSSSKFTLFINDLSNDQILYLLADTGIGFANSKVFMISDGVGTYTEITDYYGQDETNDKSMQEYNDLEQLWYKVKEKAFNHDASYLIDLQMKFGGFRRRAPHMQPVQMLDDEINIKWIVNRKRTDTFGSTQVAQEYIINNPNVVEINIYNLYKGLSVEEQKEVRELLKVDFDMINEAESQGKRILLFLGTRHDLSQGNLLDYIKFITQYVGDEYAVFYKGHPGEMSNLSSEKINALKEYGVQILDFSVPAEFFYLFKSGLSGCGYPSSTFGNVVSEIDRIPVIAGRTYEDMKVEDSNYKDEVEIYISRQSDGKYIVQDKKENKTGIWDPSTDVDQIVWK